MIAIVDYGAGNLVSVKKAFDFLGTENSITSNPDEVAKANKVVLPGVGHFASITALKQSGLQDGIERAIRCGIPFLGICVGMQWMFDGSEEASETLGMKLLPGECEKFPADVKSPHVGWNQIEISPRSLLLKGLESPSFVYFTHSFRVPVTDATVACCEYGGQFSAAVERDNLFGVQFHPEKSGEVGLKMLDNFCCL